MTPEEMNGLYKTIMEHRLPDDKEGMFVRVNIVRMLEKELKTHFFDTADFINKVDSYLIFGGKKHITDGRRIRLARQKKGWTQQQLADALNINRRTIIRFERNACPLSKKARNWLQRQEGPSGEM